MARKGTARWVLPLTALMAVWVGCGSQPGTSTYSIVLTCNPSQLLGDGSNFAVCSAVVLDQDRVPAPAGTRIAFVARNLADTSHTTGAFGTDRNDQEIRFLDDAGSTTTEFRCTEVLTAVVVAQTDSGAHGSAQVECQDIAGDWQITSLSANPGGIRPGESTQVCATAETGDGSPPPAGTLIRFTTDAAHGGFGSTYSSSRTGSTDGNGQACLNYVAREGFEETVSVTANFDNTNFGNTPRSINIIIDANLPENTIRCSVPAPATLLADGASQTPITCSVYGTGAALLPGETVACSIQNGGGSLSNGGQAVSDDNGTAIVTYTAGTDVSTVSIECAAPNVSPDATDTVSVTLIDVGTVTSLGPDTSPLGIRGTNVDESTEICFLVTDNRDRPFDTPLPVTFSTAGSTSDGALVNPTTANTDADGQACTTVSSGTTFGIVIVNACASVGATDTCGSSENIPVVGVTPSRGGMALTCDVRNIGALRYQEGTTIREPDSGSLCTQCELRLRDRDGNLVGFSHQVTFAAESGRFQPTAQATNDLNGLATVTWCADGNTPTDVAPFEGEPSWVEADTGKIRNPRDGLVTIIAYVNGEEEFTDVNQNGRWDATPAAGEDPGLFPEPFWDQSEPFVDANDDNIYEPSVENERHIDISGSGHVSGQFDGPNGQWDGDANTVIWVQTRVLLTGAPYFDVWDTPACMAPSWAECVAFDGAAAGAPDSLSFDSDYPDPARLSHWYVKSTDNTVYGNYYGPPTASPSCTEANDFCFYVPDTWSSNNRLEVYFVARDRNGNPVNGSVAGITQHFDLSDCPGAISVERGEYNSPGNALPFDFQQVRDGVVMDYEVQLSNFVSGSVQRFILAPGSGAIPGGGCRMEMQVPLTACTTCGDPADAGPWPFFIINGVPL